MNEKLMAEDVLRPYGITLYYKGCNRSALASAGSETRSALTVCCRQERC